MVTWKESSYRGGVKVRWKDTKKEGVYRMGGEGCIDVIYISDAMNEQYYLSHLPVVGKHLQLQGVYKTVGMEMVLMFNNS